MYTICIVKLNTKNEKIFAIEMKGKKINLGDFMTEFLQYGEGFIIGTTIFVIRHEKIIDYLQFTQIENPPRAWFTGLTKIRKDEFGGWKYPFPSNEIDVYHISPEWFEVGDTFAFLHEHEHEDFMEHSFIFK